MKDTNPYKPPHSDLVNEAMPDSFRSESISTGQLNLAGWLSISYAFLSIPILVISFMSVGTESESISLMSQTFTIISSVIWVYLLIILRKFLQARFTISGLGIYIWLMIFFTAVILVLSFFLDKTENTNEFTVETIAYFVSFIPYGIVTILFGKKLLSIKVPYPSLKAFSWLTIITGICMATVVLFILAIPFGIIADILLALLFFNGKKELASGDSLSNNAVKQNA